MKQLKLILIDDNEKFRQTLKTLTIYKYHVKFIGEASSAEEALKLKNLSSADIIIMDVNMPGKSGIELAKELLRFHDNSLKIIAINTHYDKVYLKTLIEAGFKGCIYKDEIINQFDRAILTVMNNKLFFPEDIPIDGRE